MGTVLVVVETTGPTNPDGYTAIVDGEFRPVGTSDSVAFGDMPTGQRSVTLGNMPLGCTPSPTLPVSVTVVAGDTARLGIVVACVTTTGALTFDMTRR